MLAVAIIAIAISVVALAVAGWNAFSDTRSAVAAEDSAVSARQSADSARASADSAARVAQLEVDRDHEAYRPAMPRPSDFVIETLPSGEEDLWLVYRQPRSYRTRADLVEGDQRISSTMSLVQPAGHDMRIFIQRLRPQRQSATVEKVHVRYWPPAAGDPHAEPWSCRCGGPSGTDSDQNLPHWEQTIPIVTPQRDDVMIA